MTEFDEIIEQLNYINDVYKGNDWLEVKKILLRALSSDLRKKFSRRDEYSKKHTINKLELKIINYYRDKFGIRLELKEDDKHNNDPIWKTRKLK